VAAVTTLEDFLDGGLDMLEAYHPATITYTVVASGSRTDYSSLTALVRDLGDTGSEIRREFWVPTATLSRDPLRGDQITDSNSDVWTVREVTMTTASRARVEASILQVRG